MNRKVNVSELRAKLSEHLRYVREGDTITVMERDTPIAEIVPAREENKKPKITPIHVPEPGLRLGDLHFKPLDPPLDVDVVEILMDLRRDKI
jgi:prevent-host-death family protein